MKLLVDNFKIKATYKNGDFYDMDGKKIEESLISQIIITYDEFKEITKIQPEKKTKKKTKDE